jgi:hypothetical protein
VGSTGSFAGSGCLEKLKRGFDGPERVVASFARVGRKERLSMEATLVPLAILHARISTLHSSSLRRHTSATYLGLEKSCGRSRGPSGTLFLPLSAELLAAGGGRDADMALEALALRNRLLDSVVFWNLRTLLSSVEGRQTSTEWPLHPTLCSIPDDPLDSSPDTFDPDRTGTSMVSIVRVAVRTGADMINAPTTLGQGQCCSQRQPRCFVPPERADNLQASSLGSARGYVDIAMQAVWRR